VLIAEVAWEKRDANRAPPTAIPSLSARPDCPAPLVAIAHTASRAGRFLWSPRPHSSVLRPSPSYVAYLPLGLPDRSWRRSPSCSKMLASHPFSPLLQRNIACYQLTASLWQIHLPQIHDSQESLTTDECGRSNALLGQSLRFADYSKKTMRSLSLNH
jgi:hypothetical protein